MNTIFIAYNHKDKILARLIYHFLNGQGWEDAEIFLDEFSIRPGEDFKVASQDKARNAKLALVILNNNSINSEYVPQEVGIFQFLKTPIVFISTHESWNAPPGYEKTNKTFPFYEWKNPFDGLNSIAELVKTYLPITDLGKIELNNKIVLYKKQGKFNEASLLCDKGIKAFDNYVFFYRNKITCLRKLGRYKEADEFADHAINKFPNNGFVIRSVAFLKWSLGKYQISIDLFSKLIRITPNDQKAFLYLGKSYLGLNDIENAVKFFSKTIDINSQKPIADIARIEIAHINGGK